MKKCNKNSVFTFMFLFMSVLFAPVNFAVAYEAAAEKTAADEVVAEKTAADEVVAEKTAADEVVAEKTDYEANADAYKKKAEEEPDCE